MRFIFKTNYAQDINIARHSGCLLYTSDAADDLLCVDLGGRRIIKKKKKKYFFFFFFFYFFFFFFFVFFFFKQKTAYEIASCLVGSEMCIRDSRFTCSKIDHYCRTRFFKPSVANLLQEITFKLRLSLIHI